MFRRPDSVRSAKTKKSNFTCTVVGVSSVHVEFDDPSNDDLVVAKFISLLENSSSMDRERILDTVHQAAAKLRQRGVELIAVKPTGSVIAFFVLQSLSAVHQLDTLYSSGQLQTILEEIFGCLLKSREAVRIKMLTWPVNNYNNCVQYFLENLSKYMREFQTLFLKC